MHYPGKRRPEHPAGEGRELHESGEWKKAPAPRKSAGTEAAVLADRTDHKSLLRAVGQWNQYWIRRWKYKIPRRIKNSRESAAHSFHKVRVQSHLRITAAFLMAARFAAADVSPRELIYTGEYDNGQFLSLDFVNSFVGWDWFAESGFLGASTVIGNIEAGHVWSGHEVFLRPDGQGAGITLYQNPAAGALNQLDYHATMVGHVLAGSGYIAGSGGEFSLVGLGMAPQAALVSGAVAVEFSASNPGSFTTTGESVIRPYRAFILGEGVTRTDVINSSWGGFDPAAVSDESVALDGLARLQPSVAMVFAAGNGNSAEVSAPASGFNHISVGSLGGPDFLDSSPFSSRGPASFYNPQTNITLAGVRAGVDISAPGEGMVLAAYLGAQGTIGAAYPGFAVEPSPADQYFVNSDGTSFAAPIVAGGIALLKDAANTLLPSLADARDTRVIKSVLMAGSAVTNGWNNGMDEMNVTTRALDYAMGAGALDLAASAEVYFAGTTGLPGTGGMIENSGWDMATIPPGDVFEYRFARPFSHGMSLTVALNWFSVREFDLMTDSGSDLAFANLDLEVWLLGEEGVFLDRVAASLSTYNNTEFLRLPALAAGDYGLRVKFDGMVFETRETTTAESFGLAWHAMAVPEPSHFLLLGAGLIVLGLRRIRSE